MKINILIGSVRSSSKTLQFALGLTQLHPGFDFNIIDIKPLPLFDPDWKEDKIPLDVKAFRESISKADGCIIITPEYIHNIPAVLKSALECLTSSGNLHNKPTLAICYTPVPPRGEKAMESLLWSLKALEANIIASTLLHHSDWNENTAETTILLKEALQLFRKKA